MDNVIVAGLTQSYFHTVDDASVECLQSYTVGENAHFFYSLLCMPGINEKHIILNVVLERNATATIEVMIAHSDVVVDIQCVLVGESSSVTIHGACIGSQANKVQIQTMQHHKAAHTSSTLKIRSVLHDSAQVNYSGMIRVEKEARCSVSSQENKNILLSDSARAVSIPCLEVLTDDVHCFHGSAIGTFDAEHIFYAASRGISAENMQQLLIEAFFVRMFKNSEIVQFLDRVL